MNKKFVSPLEFIINKIIVNKLIINKKYEGLKIIWAET